MEARRLLGFGSTVWLSELIEYRNLCNFLEIWGLRIYFFRLALVQLFAFVILLWILLLSFVLLKSDGQVSSSTTQKGLIQLTVLEELFEEAGTECAVKFNEYCQECVSNQCKTYMVQRNTRKIFQLLLWVIIYNEGRDVNCIVKGLILFHFGK